MEMLEKAQGLRRKGYEVLFPSCRTKSGQQSNMCFEMLIRRLKIDATPHGFRSSFRDWCLEATATPWAVAEAALAHQLGITSNRRMHEPIYSTSAGSS